MSAPRKPNFQRPGRAGQRCKWRLVCELVCTVTSVSVRIEKRTKCAKNNRPKSGGLFLVNARPFPEHSSSRATFSAGRAWLEAKSAVYTDTDCACWWQATPSLGFCSSFVFHIEKGSTPSVSAVLGLCLRLWVFVTVSQRPLVCQIWLTRYGTCAVYSGKRQRHWKLQQMFSSPSFDYQT